MGLPSGWGVPPFSPGWVLGFWLGLPWPGLGWVDACGMTEPFWPGVACGFCPELPAAPLSPGGGFSPVADGGAWTGSFDGLDGGVSGLPGIGAGGCVPGFDGLGVVLPGGGLVGSLGAAPALLLRARPVRRRSVGLRRLRGLTRRGSPPSPRPTDSSRLEFGGVPGWGGFEPGVCEGFDPSSGRPEALGVPAGGGAWPGVLACPPFGFDPSAGLGVAPWPGLGVAPEADGWPWGFSPGLGGLPAPGGCPGAFSPGFGAPGEGSPAPEGGPAAFGFDGSGFAPAPEPEGFPFGSIAPGWPGFEGLPGGFAPSGEPEGVPPFGDSPGFGDPAPSEPFG